MINEQTKTSIAAEAEKFAFQVPYNGTNDFYNDERYKSYITGAERWAELAQPLVEALERIKEMSSRDLASRELINRIATEALTKYNNPK